MMDADYPAAHSMDACFFAIDRDGHVAFFTTGEAGAVPEAAFTGDEAHEAVTELVETLPRCEGLQDPRGIGRPPGAEFEGCHLVVDLPYPVLMFLDSEEPVRAELASGAVTRVPATEGVGVAWRRLAAADRDRLHAAGLCRGCTFFFDPQEGGDGPPSLAEVGLYVYGHLTENWIAGPYGRRQVPAHPVHVDRLPPDLRRKVKGMRFDALRFAEAAHIQPAEHGPVISWELSYLDVTGKHQRPIPGREDENAGREESREETGPGVEPPGADEDIPF
jgi:hypothetical protein